MIVLNDSFSNEWAIIDRAIEKQQLDSERTIIIQINFNNF